MPNVILQPCGNDLAFDHFQHTISNEVSLHEIRKYIADSDWRKLKRIYTRGTCPIWGVEPKEGGNIKKWQKIVPGDLAFFARRMTFIASGTVTLALHNRQLARHLWDGGANRSTWEYIYFLADVRPMAAPVPDFNLALGYGANYPVRSFTVLENIKSELALEYFGMEPLLDTHFPTVRTAEREISIPKMDKTDKDVMATQRREQDYLTRSLHRGKKSNFCAICHRQFPVSFLVTAHIKRRSHCSHDERLDENVAMPLCNMGCDQLYERGYVSVRDGTVAPLIRGPMSVPIKEYIDTVIGNECLYFSEYSRTFFEWHWDFHRIRQKQKVLR